MNLGGISEAFATPRKAPIFRASHSACSKILTVKYSDSLAIATAVSARVTGVTIFAGAETNSLARITPSTICWALAIAKFASSGLVSRIST